MSLFRCKCSKTEYLINYKYLTKTCNGRSVYWATFSNIDPEVKAQTFHVHYCPFCGKKLPKRSV